MHDRVEWAGLVGIGGELFEICDGREVTYDDALGFGNSSLGLGGSRAVAGVEEDVVALLTEEFGCCLSQTVRATGDKYACHRLICSWG